MSLVQSEVWSWLLGELWPEKGAVQHDQYNQVKMLVKLAKTERIDQLAHSEEQ
jgi:hypothetical protein